MKKSLKDLTLLEFINICIENCDECPFYNKMKYSYKLTKSCKILNVQRRVLSISKEFDKLVEIKEECKLCDGKGIYLDLETDIMVECIRCKSKK